MADKLHTVEDPATEALFLELFTNIDLGTTSHQTKAGNISGQYLTKTDTGVADTEFSISHTLDRVPVGYIVVYTNLAGVVYDSGTTWTTSTIYLKCSAANASIKILVW